MHVNAKGMSLAKPHSEVFSWKNIAYWQNPQLNNNSDYLNVAIQHANLSILPTQILVVSNPTFPTTQDITLPILSASQPATAAAAPYILDTQSTISHASIFTQTTPTYHLSLANGMDANIPISLWQLMLIIYSLLKSM